MQNKYFDITNFYDSNYPTTFVLGARGVGKTVSSLAWLIKKSYKDKAKFVYLRRYQVEIDTLGLPLRLLSKLTGLDVTIDHITDDSGRSSKMIMVQGENDDKPIGVGYLLALSVVSKYKSSDYSGVWIILYDEFIDINDRELKNEVNIYLNFAMTVFRDFSKYRSIFLANATNLYNCYFVEFNFYPSGAISKNKELGIKIVMYRTSIELNKRNKLPLAKMMEAVNQDDPSLSNKFSVEYGFVSKLNGKSKCKELLLYNGKNYGLWFDGNTFYLSDKFDKDVKRWVSLDSVKEDYFYNPIAIKTMSNLLINGQLFFTNETIRGIFMKLFKNKRYI